MLFKLSAIILTMVMVLSCSSEGGKTSDLLGRIPRSADLVIIGNANTVLESLGGSFKDSEIQLPSYITDLTGTGDVDRLNAFLKGSGIDFNACGMFLSYDAPNPIFVFRVDNQKKFEGVIQENGFVEGDKEGDITLYICGEIDCCVALDNNFGYLCQDNRKAINGLKDAIEEVKDGTYASTPMGRYISKGNALGLAFRMPRGERFAELEHLPFPLGGVCMYGDLKGDLLSLTCKVVDRDGNDIKDEQFSKYMDTKARINPQAMAFLGKDECLALATSMKDVNWDELFDMIGRSVGLSRRERANLSIVKNYLEMIDGTIAIGLGVTDGLSSFSKIASGDDVLSELSFTLVVETKDGKGKSLLSDIMGFMEGINIPLRETSDGFTISLESFGTLYAENKGDILVFSNHAISSDGECNVVKQVKFSDYIGAAALVLDHKNQLMQDLFLSGDIKLVVSSDGTNESKMTLEVSGGEGGVLEKLVRIGLSLYQNSERIMRNLRGGSYYGYSDYDEIFDDDLVYDDEEVKEDFEWDEEPDVIAPDDEW